MTKPSIHILSLNGGNVTSIINALDKIGVASTVIQEKSDLENATHLIIPGIGHYDRAMNYLEANGLFSLLRLKIIEQQTPTLGICLGMHLLAGSSEEGKSTGLGIFDVEVKELKVSNTLRYKVPHNGWNTLIKTQDCPILSGIETNEEFFFLHKYTWDTVSPSHIYANTIYDISFPAIVGQNNCWGVQFHPEKSHDAGLQLLKNFIQL